MRCCAPPISCCSSIAAFSDSHPGFRGDDGSITFVHQEEKRIRRSFPGSFRDQALKSKVRNAAACCPEQKMVCTVQIFQGSVPGDSLAPYRYFLRYEIFFILSSA